eukprot:366178-Chlamydomonas_euryale.AAC.3
MAVDSDAPGGASPPHFGIYASVSPQGGAGSMQARALASTATAPPQHRHSMGYHSHSISTASTRHDSFKER